MFTFEATDSNSESLKIDRKKPSVKGAITTLTYKDKDTKQYVVYCPSLEVSGYGETEEKAQEMFWFSVDALYTYWMNSSLEVMQRELKELGWIQDHMFRKEFSKAFVDEAGLLQGLNAEDGKVKRTNLSLAA